MGEHMPGAYGNLNAAPGKEKFHRSFLLQTDQSIVEINNMRFRGTLTKQ
jgi:hypothetical protein